MPKILIFGASGFTGGRLVEAALRSGWQVTAATRSPNDGFSGLDWQQIDITDEAAAAHLIHTLRPQAVINAAAFAEIDKAEKEPQRAFQVNTQAAAALARACAESGSRYIYFSSDAVFDGTAPSYSEESPVNPLNIYGQSKASGEQQIMTANPTAVIVRVSLILGFPVKRGNSYLLGIRNRLGAETEMIAPAAEIRTPVDIHTLCAATLELAQNTFSGILHIGATAAISRYTMTCRLAELLGYDPRLVIPTPPPQSGRAPRHQNGILSVEKARRVLTTPMLSLDETLSRSVNSNFFTANDTNTS